jgi:xanthine dehydrogenase accessory factor
LVLLFHDHDWEEALLAQALEQPAFFIGAMGSRATQARRLANLASRGIAPAALARLAGPIGLIAAARDPDTLALSAMAHIVAAYGDRTARRLSHPALPSLAPA